VAGAGERLDAVGNVINVVEQRVEVFPSMKFLFVVFGAHFHEKARGFVFHAHVFAHEQVAVSQCDAQLPDVFAGHVGLGEPVAAKRVCEFFGVEAVVLFLARADGAQHVAVTHFKVIGVGPQEVINPAGEQRGFHGYGPGAGQAVSEAVQVFARGVDGSVVQHGSVRLLHAVSDGFFVDI